jgi:hypothetical protein
MGFSPTFGHDQLGGIINFLKSMNGNIQLSGSSFITFSLGPLVGMSCRQHLVNGEAEEVYSLLVMWVQGSSYHLQLEPFWLLTTLIWLLI